MPNDQKPAASPVNVGQGVPQARPTSTSAQSTQGDAPTPQRSASGLSRLDSFVLGLAQSEVQRKGIGMNPGALISCRDLAVKLMALIDAGTL